MNPRFRHYGGDGVLGLGSRSRSHPLPFQVGGLVVGDDGGGGGVATFLIILHELELSLDVRFYLFLLDDADSRCCAVSPERLGRLGEEMMVVWVSGMDRLDALLRGGVRLVTALDDFSNCSSTPENPPAFRRVALF